MSSDSAAGDRTRSVLAIAGLLRTNQAEVARAIVAVVEGVAEGSLSQLSRHGLRMLLEDRGLAADEDEVWDGLLASGFAEQSGKRLDLRRELDLSAAYEELTPGDRALVSLDDIAALLRPASVVEEPSAVATPRELMATVRRVQRWGADLIATAANEDMTGFPVFWGREGGMSVPFGVDYGTMAAADTPLLMLEPERFGITSNLSEAALAAMERAWDQLLALGVDPSGDWYDGSLFVPFFDDDFVGSFVKERAVRGSCPTLEATAQRTYSLLMLLEHVPTDQKRQEDCRDALEAAVDCIVRWQDDDGGWAIHRYDRSSPYVMPVRDVSTWYASRALLAAVNSSALSVELQGRVDESLSRVRDLLKRTVVVESGGAYWDGDFVDAATGSRQRATCLMAQLLGPLHQHLDDSQLGELLNGGVQALASSWKPDAEELLAVEFRCPTWDGAALATFTWEMPRDALMLETFCIAAAHRAEIDEGLVERIHAATAGVLEHEANGSWLDIPLKREGLYKAFASNSVHALRAVLNVLAWQLGHVPAGVRFPVIPAKTNGVK